MDALKIGDFLYKYIWAHGTFKYEVIGIRAYKDSILYEIRCMECRDHTPCELLVIRDRSKDERYSFVDMINNYYGYDEDITDQTYWHNGKEDGTEFFYRDKKASCSAYGVVLIRKGNARVDKAKEELKRATDEAERLNRWIEEYAK